ncbi:hypothetical protein [Vibrio sp. CB1-14]|uniref:Uncharacterized protein n=1 Tax=Vibrio chaetopteri TaxID=3016528 RepID=A0AAU8BJ98_9VIBR
MRNSLYAGLSLAMTLLTFSPDVFAAELPTKAHLYWNSDTLDAAQSAELSTDKPWVTYTQTALTSSLSRGDNTLRIAIEDSEGGLQSLTFSLTIPTLPSNQTDGQSNALDYAELRRSSSSTVDTLTLKESGGESSGGQVWAYFQGEAEFDGSVGEDVNLSLFVYDAYSNTVTTPLQNTLNIPNFSDQPLGGLANVITKASLNRSSRTLANSIEVKEASGHSQGVGYVWAVMVGTGTFTSADIGDIQLTLDASDAYSDTQAVNMALSIGAERLAGAPIVTSMSAMLNDQELPIADAKINGPLYQANFTTQRVLASSNYTTLETSDSLGASAQYAPSYFAFFDGDTDFIDDRFDPDLDNDGLTNEQELIAGTDQYKANTDGDALDDYTEISNKLNPLDPNDLALDPDKDGLSNLEEVNLGTDIANADSDGDGIADGTETQYGLNPTDGADGSQDLDKDGISNAEEIANGYDPLSRDSDGDGIFDNQELTLGLDPLDASDASKDNDGDGISNLDELLAGTNINAVDSDDDGVSDFQELVNGTDPLDPTDSVVAQIKPYLWADISGDGAQDIVTLSTTTLPQMALSILDGSNLTPINTTSLDFGFSRVELLKHDDYNQDGIADIALFGFIESLNRYSMVIVDPSDNFKVLKRYNWPGSLANVKPYLLADLTGDGVGEVAIAGQNKMNKTNQLIVKNGQSAASLRTYKWVNNWDDVIFITLEDRTGDKVPEVAMFGIHKRTNKAQLFVLDGASASKLEVYNWSNKLANGTLVLTDDINQDGYKDIGVFAQRSDDNRYQLFVKHGDTKAGRVASITWPSSLTDGRIQLVQDQTFDGVQEVALFGLSGSGANARYKVWINDGANNGRQANLAWPDRWTDASIEQVADLDQDSIKDIALLGYNKDTGDFEVSIKSSVSTAQLITLTLGSNVNNVVIRNADLNGDRTEDLFISWVDSSTSVSNVIAIDGSDVNNRLFEQPLN